MTDAADPDVHETDRPLDDPSSTDAPSADDDSSRSRIPTVLVGLATVLLVFSTFAVWVKSAALNTDDWVDLSDGLLAEPEIRESLAGYLVDELYESLDIAAEIERLLPEDLGGLAGPLTGALRSPITDGVERVIGSDVFAAAWSTTNRTAHETLVAVLRDETGPAVSTADGSVTMDLKELLRFVGGELGLSSSLLDDLPEDAGVIVIFESDELAAAQNAVRALDFLSWFLVAAVVLMYAAAVYLSVGRRRRTLRNVGIGMAGAGVTVLAIRAIAVRVTLDAVVQNQASRPTAEAVGAIATQLIRQISWSLVLYGLVIAAFAALLGDGRRASSVRRFIAPAFTAATGGVALGTGLFILFLLWWSPGRAFDGWLTGVILIALVISAVVALRRTVVEEFPTVTFDDSFATITRRSRR